MLKCRDINKLATDYQDRKLSVGGRLQYALHLLICGNCREFVQQLGKAVQVYRKMENEQQQALDSEQARAMCDSIIARAENERN